MSYRYRSILHSDAGKLQTRLGPSTGAIERNDMGWAVDSAGRAFIRTSGAIAYRYHGMCFTSDGSLLVDLTPAVATSDYVWGGIRFSAGGRAHSATIVVP